MTGNSRAPSQSPYNDRDYMSRQTTSQRRTTLQRKVPSLQDYAAYPHAGMNRSNHFVQLGAENCASDTDGAWMNQSEQETPPQRRMQRTPLHQSHIVPDQGLLSNNQAIQHSLPAMGYMADAQSQFAPIDSYSHDVRHDRTDAAYRSAVNMHATTARRPPHLWRLERTPDSNDHSRYGPRLHEAEEMNSQLSQVSVRQGGALLAYRQVASRVEMSGADLSDNACQLREEEVAEEVQQFTRMPSLSGDHGAHGMVQIGPIETCQIQFPADHALSNGTYMMTFGYTSISDNSTPGDTNREDCSTLSSSLSPRTSKEQAVQLPREMESSTVTILPQQSGSAYPQYSPTRLQPDTVRYASREPLSHPRHYENEVGTLDSNGNSNQRENQAVETRYSISRRGNQHRLNPTLSSGRTPSPSTCNSVPLQCLRDGCTAQFTGNYKRGNLARHRRHRHGGSEQNGVIVSCEAAGCDKLFKRKDARLKHYRTCHSELAPCPLRRRKQSSPGAF